MKKKEEELKLGDSVITPISERKGRITEIVTKQYHQSYGVQYHSPNGMKIYKVVVPFPHLSGAIFYDAIGEFTEGDLKRATF